MFKLQLVLGLLLGIQFNVIRAEEQLRATATLGNATFDITISGSSLDSHRGKTINTSSTNLSVDGNPEEGEHIEGDLLYPSAVLSQSAYHKMNSLKIKRKGSIEAKNNIFPLGGNPERIEYIESDLLYPSAVPSQSDYENTYSVKSRTRKSNETEKKHFPLNGNPEEGEYLEGDLLNPTAVQRRSAYENINSVDSLQLKINEIEKSNIQEDARPEEGNNVEGDLLVPAGDLFHTSILRTGSLWPGGLVPYRLNGTFTHAEIRALLYAFDQYAAKTCIRFYPHTTEKDFMSIYRHETDCSSYVGRMGGKQVINLAPNCFLRYGTVMHELMHILGFLHEHSNYNRDKYIKILFKNVKPGLEFNFPKSSEQESKNLGIPYDYGSIMHYRADAFSKNGEPTIESLRKLPKGVKMGQRKGFSQYDVEKINRRYQCDKLKFFRKV